MEQSVFKPESTPEHYCLTGVSWAQFEQLAESFENIGHIKLNYLDGNLEIMVPPNEEHENIKCTVEFLLEVYLRHCGLVFYRRGSPRLDKNERASAEPDKAYCIGSYKTLPDLAIEVIVASGSVGKLKIYQRLSIPMEEPVILFKISRK